jgi:acyl transferase domain-containing protein
LRNTNLTEIALQFIIDSAASFNAGMSRTIPPAIREPNPKPAVLFFSAGRPQALKAMVETHGQYLAKHPERLSDVTYTLSARRERLKSRAFCVTDGSEPLGEPAAVTCQDIEQVAFVFTGQGAQW